MSTRFQCEKQDFNSAYVAALCQVDIELAIVAVLDAEVSHSDEIIQAFLNKKALNKEILSKFESRISSSNLKCHAFSALNNV